MSDGFSSCPRCGGELEYGKDLERQVRVADDVALVKVKADVCTRCGELLLHPGMVDRIARVKQALKKSSAPVVGRVFDYRDSAI